MLQQSTLSSLRPHFLAASAPVRCLLGGPCSCLQDDVTSVLSAGPAILAGSVDGTLRRFDVRMGRIYTDQLHHPVSELALTHDGLCVLAACLDSCLRLLDVEAGELLASYRWAMLQLAADAVQVETGAAVVVYGMWLVHGRVMTPSPGCCNLCVQP
eukprot:GHRQ01031951.1.p2 GENE.GHRQ01031951.1~~GHRQ01031951.1.p2  ORF type:complete len:156 (-),score=33.70 GHRQ01031951.1:234-701(-)